MSEQPAQEYVLGIDLGSNSLGWAIVGLIDGEPAQMIRTGVRVFEAGVKVDAKSGREKTLNAQRREALQQRRQIWRHRRRLVKIGHILQRAILLPQGNLGDSKARQQLFNDLDERAFASAWFQTKYPICGIQKAKRTKEQKLEVHRLKQLLPYLIRAAAVEEKIEDPQIVGRALYHLAQRRGFWSNRKTAPKKDEKPGEIEQGIRTLRTEMGERKTLGQHFSSLSPFERRIRDQWTSRDMYQSEFKAIWEKQAEHHLGLLTEEERESLRIKLFDAIFDQRPPKLKGGLVGQCEFEPSERRAPAYLLISQRFRLLQVVNNFRYRPRGGDWQRLSPDKRRDLIAALERRPSMEFKEVRELLALSRSHAINLQRDKEEARMPGNDTAAQLVGVFGECWPRSASEHRKIVASADSILGIRDLDESRRRAKKYLANRGVDDLEKACEAFLNIKFEAGYRSLSVKAMERFIPLLENGFQYGAISPHYRYLHEAKDKLIGLVEAGLSHDAASERVLNRKPEPVTPLDAIPPVLAEEVQERIGTIRNPIVIRSLTELRKVVNAVIERFGKPTRVHIELLRDLKKPKAVREKIWKENLGRDKRNKGWKEKIKELAPDLVRVRPRDIEKYRLWEESKHCPYCLKGMTPRLMFGEDSEYQIDHIIPFGLSLDDSFTNKVLCHTACNRRKGQRTPFQAFGESPEGYDYRDMLECVRRFPKDTREEKLRRFKMDGQKLREFLERRPAQQFNDSAYASRVAADYLALLYGGRTDTDGNLRVQVRTGGLTKYFREAWGLNSILGEGDSNHGGKILKPRHDHRHHAIDAAVIAATDQDMVRRLNDAAKRRLLDDPGRFGGFAAPSRWPRFRNELRSEVTRESPERVQVSHRVSKKVSGPLHKETNYTPGEFGRNVRRHRVAVRDLSVKDIMSETVIPDRGVREAVQNKLQEIGGDPKKFPLPDEQASFDGFPCFIKGERRIPIKKVRIQETLKTRKIGDGPSVRYVKPGGNHHLEIFGLPGTDGRDKKWETLGVVTMLDAYQRLRQKPPQPVVQRAAESGWGFRFSLAQGETLLFDEGPFKGQYFVVRTISEEEKSGSVKIEVVPINDARLKADIKRSKLWITKSPNELRKWGGRKVVVSPIGEVTEAHD